jgi:hypothetical protein
MVCAPAPSTTSQLTLESVRHRNRRQHNRLHDSQHRYRFHRIQHCRHPHRSQQHFRQHHRFLRARVTRSAKFAWTDRSTATAAYFAATVVRRASYLVQAARLSWWDNRAKRRRLTAQVHTTNVWRASNNSHLTASVETPTTQQSQSSTSTGRTFRTKIIVESTSTVAAPTVNNNWLIPVIAVAAGTVMTKLVV